MSEALEKQLLLNNTSFSHQLALEKKKTIEAQLITTSLQMEIKLLNQKIKEKERELGVRNIYANRMLKGQQDKGISESSPKDRNVSKSVQVNLKLEEMTLQKHETMKTAVGLKEELTSKDRNAKDTLCDMHKETLLKTDVHSAEKLPVQEFPKETCSEFLGEEICSSAEQYFKYENTERQKNRRKRQGLDLLKEEFEKLRTEKSFQSNDVQQKESNLEETLNQKQENKESKQVGKSKEAFYDKLATVTQRHRTPSKLKKHYVFTEAVNNLHQGLPSTGPLSNMSTTFNSGQVNRNHTEIMEFKAGDLTNVYEPSFGKATKARQKDISSIHAEDHIPTLSVDKKITLMEELFGQNCILKDSHPTSNVNELGKGKKNLTELKDI
ncbi:lebercilin-like protein [Varanus komodoensis]|uniref:lebercilin-like protein n=1 Tax=Varanus komodoensis TaxID=61221 RepID=UPI001CF7D69B|nr:lebercilin-like protein [Varanus komodoensis]